MPSSPLAHHLFTMACNNAWANHRLLAACARLSQADFLPLEQVRADPPRVVFTVGNSLAEEDRMLHHPALAGLQGIMRVPLDSSILWCGGPTIPRALDRLAEARRELERRGGNPQQDPGGR